MTKSEVVAFNLVNESTRIMVTQIVMKLCYWSWTVADAGGGRIQGGPPYPC